MRFILFSNSIHYFSGWYIFLCCLTFLLFVILCVALIFFSFYLHSSARLARSNPFFVGCHVHFFFIRFLTLLFISFHFISFALYIVPQFGMVFLFPRSNRLRCSTLFSIVAFVVAVVAPHIIYSLLCWHSSSSIESVLLDWMCMHTTRWNIMSMLYCI